MMDAMGANFVRLTVVSDDNQLDVSLPAQRPVVEYIDDVVGLLGPSASAAGSAWTLSTPSLGPIDLEDTLADYQIFDGARLSLTKAPDAAPPPFVDDVLAEMQRTVDVRYATWIGAHRRKWIAAAVAVVVGVCSVLVAVDGERWPVVGVLAALALAALGGGLAARRTAMGHVAWSALAPATLATWRAAEANSLAERVVFALAAIALVVAVVAGGVLASRPIVAAAGGTAVVFAAVGLSFALGANPVAASVWALPVLVLGVIIAPRIALSSSGLLAQIRLSERMELAQREAVAAGLGRGRLIADAIVWATSVLGVPAVATIALSGVWQQGLAAVVFVVIWLLRSRNFTHVRHVAPMILAGAAGAAFLAAGLARWIGASGGSYTGVVGVVAAALAVAFGCGALPSLGEVGAARARRVLDGVDLPLALVFVPVVFFAQGVYSLVWPS